MHNIIGTFTSFEIKENLKNNPRKIEITSEKS